MNNFCGSNLYNPEKHFESVKSMALFGKEIFEAWLNNNFIKEDAIKLAAAEEAGILDEGFSISHDSSDSSSLVQDNGAINIAPVPFVSLYDGGTENAQYKIAHKAFVDRLISSLIWNPDTGIGIDDPNDFNGNTTIVNEQLRLYKEDLLDIISKAGIPLLKINNPNSAVEQYMRIAKALFDFNEKLAKSKLGIGEKPSDEQINAFNILRCFDELVEESGLVSIAPEYKNKAIEASDKYSFVGGRINYIEKYGEENASIEDYTAPVLKIILDSTIRPLHWKGDTEVEHNSTIGFQNFKVTMGNFYEWLWEQDSYNIVKERDKGINANWDYLLSTYLKEAPLIFSEACIIRGIQKYVFRKNMPTYLRNMFVCQMLDTVNPSYVEYIQQGGEIKTSLAQEKLLSKNTIVLKSKISTNIAFLRRDHNFRDNLFATLGVNYIPSTDTFSIKIGDSVADFTWAIKEDDFTYKPDSDNSIAILRDNFNAFRNIVERLTGIPIPDETLEYSQDTMESFINNWVPALAAIVKLSTLYDSSTIFDEYGVPKLFNNGYDKSMLSALRKLSGVYNFGISPKYRNIEGNTIPGAQLGSYFFRTHQIIDKINKNSDNHVNGKNIFVENKNALGNTNLREGIKFGGRSKTILKMLPSEISRISILYDFYDRITGEATSRPILMQVMTFADKTRQMLKEVDLDKIKTGGNYSLLYYVKAVLDGHEAGEKLLLKQIKDYRGEQVKRASLSLLNRCLAALGLNDSIHALSDKVSYEEINQIKATVEKTIKEKFGTGKSGVNAFLREFKGRNIDSLSTDFLVGKDGQIYLNPLLFHYLDIFLGDEQNFEGYISDLKTQLIKDLEDIDFTMDTWSDFKLHRRFSENPALKGWYVESDRELLLSKGGKLNPILNAYFLTHLLLGQQLKTLHFAESWNYEYKGDIYDPENHDWKEDISLRFIDQSKRALNAGATIKKFTKGIYNGVSDRLRMAFCLDLNAGFFNLTGDTTEDIASDGCTWSSPYQAIMENNSLGAGRVNKEFKKAIFSMPAATGEMVEVKTATFTITNTIRKQNPYSKELNMEKMFRLMHKDPINIGRINLSYYYGNFTDGDTFSSITKSAKSGQNITWTKPIYFSDPRTGEIYKILKIDQAGKEVQRHLIRVSQNGAEQGEVIIESPRSINSLYDLDQLFGGAWCMDLDPVSGKLKESDANNQIVATIICEENLKDKFIHYVAPISSVKTGIKNVNPSDVFDSSKSDEDLWEVSFDPEYSGVQLNAGHFVEGGHVTEMSQMITALIQGGHLVEMVDIIYNAIADITKEGSKRFLQNERNVKLAIAEALMSAIHAPQDGSPASLVDLFIIKAKEAFNKYKIDPKLPYSHPSIKEKFVSTIVSILSNSSLRRKYPGLGAVQAPSYGHMQYFTGNRNFNDIAKSVRKLGFIGNDFDLAFRGDWDGEYLTDAFVQKYRVPKEQIRSLEKQGTIPVLESIDISDIDFEDTIVFKDNGNWHVVKIKDAKTRDAYRNLYSFTSDIYRWNTQGRDLLPQILRFSGSGTEATEAGEFQISQKNLTLWDFDSSRALSYLSEILKFGYNKPKDSIQSRIWEERDAFLRSYYANFDDIIADKELLKQTIKAEKKIFASELAEYGRKLRSGQSYTTHILGHGNITLSAPEVSHAQIILGKVYGSLLGLEPGDSVHELLNNPEILKKRVRSEYAIEKGVPKNMYDAVMHSRFGNVYVLLGDPASPYIQNALKACTGISDSFKNVEGELYFNGENLGSAEGLQFATYVNERGESYNFIYAKSVDNLKNLLDSKVFDCIKYNYTEENYERLFREVYKNNFRVEEQNGKLIETVVRPIPPLRGLKTTKKLPKNLLDILKQYEYHKFQSIVESIAVSRYEAFKKSLTMIGARIPTQAMQSFTACDVINFTESEENAVYLPRIVTWIAGSDYDIDKFYLMGWSIMNNGTLPIKGILEGFSLDDINSLPNPINLQAEETTVAALEADSTNNPELKNLIVSTEDLIKFNSGDIEPLKRVLNTLKNTGYNKIAFDIIDIEPGSLDSVLETLRSEDIPETWEIADRFLRAINRYNNKANAHRVAAVSEHIFKNNVVNNIVNALGDPSVQLNLFSVLNMTSIKEGTKNNERAQEEKKTLNPDNPIAIFKQQYNNMVAKEGVARVATSQKAFNTISFAINLRIDRLIKEGLTDDELIANCEDLANSISFKDTFDGDVLKTFANINLTPLLLELERRDLTKYSVYKTLTEINNNSNITDATDLYSQVMSAATDNAKYLYLYALNATSDFIDLYCYLIASGVSFDKITKFFTSDTFNIVTRFMKDDIFRGPYYGLNVEKVINFILDKDDLPVVQYNFKDKIKHFVNLLLSDNELSKTEYKQALLKKLGYNELSYSESGERFETKTNDGTTIVVPEETVLSACRNLFYDYENIETGKNPLTDIFLEKEGTSQIVLSDDDIMNMPDDEWEFDVVAKKKDYVYTPYSYYINHILRKKNQLLKKLGQGFKQVEAELGKALKLLPGAEEFRVLGQILSINQGLKAGTYQFYDYIAKINAGINRIYWSRQSENHNLIKFDLIKFIQDQEYREEQIEAFEEVKDRTNVLKVLVSSPHFWQMEESVALINKLLSDSSAAYRLQMKMATDIFDSRATSDISGKVYAGNSLKYKLDEAEFKRLGDFANDLIIFNFLRNLDPEFVLRLPNGDTLDFSTNKNITSFKTLVETVIIPQLKTIYPDNKFLRLLTLDSKKIGENSLNIFYKLGIDISDASIATPLHTLTTQARGDFLKVANNSIEDVIASEGKSVVINGKYNWTIGDILYLYDLIVSRGNYGYTGLKGLFTEFVNNEQYSNGFLESYTAYIEDLDAGKIEVIESENDSTRPDLITYDVEDAISTVLDNKQSNAYKFNKRDGETKRMTLESPSTSTVFGFGVSKYGSEAYANNIKRLPPFAYAKRPYNINSKDAVVFLTKQMAEAFGQDTVNMVDDAKIKNWYVNKTGIFSGLDDTQAYLKYKSISNAEGGFIDNGQIYINLDHMHATTMMHELSHFICAALKFGDEESRNTYYKMIEFVWNELTDEAKAEKEDTHEVKFSDLKEEVLVEAVAKTFTDKLSDLFGENEERTKGQLTGVILNALSKIFGSEDIKSMDPVDLEKLGADQIFNFFMKKAISLETSAFSTKIVLGQELMNIKLSLFNTDAELGDNKYEHMLDNC